MSSKELDDLRRQFTGILRHSAASFRGAALVVEQYAHIVESGGLPTAHEIAQIAAQLPSAHSADDKRGKKGDNSLFPPLTPVDEDDTKKRKRAPKKPKDPNAPKRPASAYILYQNQVRGPLKEKHPEWNNSDLLGQVSRDWATLTDAQKKPFVDATALAKQEYDIAKAKYDASLAAANGAGPSTVKPAASASPADESESDEQNAVATIVATKPRKSKEATKSASPPKKEKKKKEPTPPSTESGTEESDGEGDDSEETEEPPKKKHKKEVTPPPAKKHKKSSKEEKGSKKK